MPQNDAAINDHVMMMMMMTMMKVLPLIGSTFAVLRCYEAPPNIERQRYALRSILSSVIAALCAALRMCAVTKPS